MQEDSAGIPGQQGTRAVSASAIARKRAPTTAATLGGATPPGSDAVAFVGSLLAVVGYLDGPGRGGRRTYNGDQPRGLTRTVDSHTSYLFGSVNAFMPLL